MSAARCTLCRGVMLPEWGTRFRRCPTCREAWNEYQKRRSKTPGGREERRQAQQRYRNAHREDVRAYERLVYSERRQSGSCSDCENPPEPGKGRCASCRAAHNSRSLASYHRRKNANGRRAA